MKIQISAQAYHLRYLPEEDRILLSVGTPQNGEFGVVLTRRLMRFLLEAIAKVASQRAAAPSSSVTPFVRDTLLDFEHSKQVAAAVAEGAMKDEKRDVALAMPPKLVRQVTIAPKGNNALALVFDDPELLLSVEVSADRLHMVIETLVRISERAGWDFPPMASWLDSAKQALGSTGRSVN